MSNPLGEIFIEIRKKGPGPGKFSRRRGLVMTEHHGLTPATKTDPKRSPQKLFLGRRPWATWNPVFPAFESPQHGGKIKKKSNHGQWGRHFEFLLMKKKLFVMLSGWKRGSNSVPGTYLHPRPAYGACLAAQKKRVWTEGPIVFPNEDCLGRSRGLGRNFPKQPAGRPGDTFQVGDSTEPIPKAIGLKTWRRSDSPTLDRPAGEPLGKIETDLFRSAKIYGP